jgi:hypothetical protein
MKTPMRAALSAVLGLCLAACSEATGPGAGLRVETAQSAYPLPGGPGISSLSVQFWVRNTGSETVALRRCGAAVTGELQRREAGTWVTVSSGICLADQDQSPLLLAPGEAAYGETALAEAGRYRIRVAVAEETGGEFSSYTVSRDFVVLELEN